MSDEPPTSGLDVDVEILRMLLQEENDGQRTTLEIGPFTANLLIGLCQLGVRTLKPGDPRAQVFRSVSAQLEPIFHGTAAGDIIEAGWTQLRNEGR